jgi:hypothetical protein
MARSLAVLVTIAAALACASPALAATPFTVGTGYGHDLAVGTDGTGHVVWLTDEEPEDRVGYCRVPAGASTCDGESGFLDFPGTSAFSLNDDAQVFTPAPNVVVVLGSCFTCPTGAQDHVYRWISTNNGADFSGPTDEGDIALGGQSGYIDAASDVILGTEGGLFQAMDDPVPSPDTLELSLGGGGSFVYSPAVVYDPATDKAVHVINDLDTVKYAYLTDATPTAAELNTSPTAPLAANEWHTNNFLSSPEGDNDETHASAGPAGIFMTYRVFVPGNSRVGLRRFDPVSNTFGAPVYADGENTVDNNSLDLPHHSQDAGGRLHFVWRSLYDGNRLRYTRSDDGGATFTAPGNLAVRETFIDPIVEAGPSGTGFAVWKGTGGSEIRVVVIDPQPEPATGGGPGGGSDTSDPTVGGFGASDITLTPGQGTEFSFTTSEAGQALMTFHKRVKGLKVRQRGRRRCVPQTRRRLRQLRRRAGSRAEFRRLVRRRRCRTWKKVGQIRREVLAGRNTIVWNGRVAGRRLSPGLYEVRLTVRDGAGNVSSVERLRFRVRRARR